MNKRNNPQTISALSVLAIAAIAGPLRAQSPSANLVHNGSFEIAPIMEEYSNRPIPGWCASGSNPKAHRDNGDTEAYEGMQWIELDGQSNTSVYQDIPTTAGQTYRLSFAFANRRQAPSSSIRVHWDGQLVTTVSTTQTPFQVSTYFVTARTSVTRLQFSAAGRSDGYGDYLDAVAVAPDYGMMLPHFADGQGWTTSITFSNPTRRQVRVDMQVNGPNGQELDPAYRFARTLRAGESATFVSPGTASTVRTGWVQIDTELDISVTSVFRLRSAGRPDFEAAVPVRKPSSRLYASFDNLDGYFTGIAIMNPREQRVNLDFTFRDERGLELLTRRIPLEGGNHESFSLPGRFAELAGRRGSLEVTGRADDGAEVEFAALGLRFNPGGAFASLPY